MVPSLLTKSISIYGPLYLTRVTIAHCSMCLSYGCLCWFATLFAWVRAQGGMHMSSHFEAWWDLDLHKRVTLVHMLPHSPFVCLGSSINHLLRILSSIAITRFGINRIEAKLVTDDFNPIHRTLLIHLLQGLLYIVLVRTGILC